MLEKKTKELEKMEIELICPAEGEEISFLTQEQKHFLSDGNRAVPHTPDPTPRTVDLTVPRSVGFEWRAAEPDSELQIAPSPDFGEIMRFPGVPSCGRKKTKGERSSFSAEVRNLPCGRKYFWRAAAGEDFSPVRSFTTARDLPRWIAMPEVTNVRDIGNWPTRDGRVIRQEMVYRGAQLDAWPPPPECAVNDEGRHVFFDVLKIRTELDLRGKTPVLPVERFRPVVMQAYATWNETGIFSAEQMAAVKKIFDLFADPDTYPVYIHCMGGGDRTGTVAFLLEAMLGVDIADMITEYELSNLSVSGERSRFSAVWTKFMEKLETFAPGGSRNDQISAYLAQCGVTKQTQEKIRKILLTDPTPAA